MGLWPFLGHQIRATYKAGGIGCWTRGPWEDQRVLVSGKSSSWHWEVHSGPFWGHYVTGFWRIFLGPLLVLSLWVTAAGSLIEAIIFYLTITGHLWRALARYFFAKCLNSNHVSLRTHSPLENQRVLISGKNSSWNWEVHSRPLWGHYVTVLGFDRSWVTAWPFWVLDWPLQGLSRTVNGFKSMSDRRRVTHRHHYFLFLGSLRDRFGSLTVSGSQRDRFGSLIDRCRVFLGPLMVVSLWVIAAGSLIDTIIFYSTIIGHL